jgi:hypothetical protein
MHGMLRRVLVKTGTYSAHRYNQLFTNLGRLGDNNTLLGKFAWQAGAYTGYSSLNYTTANGTEGTWIGIAEIVDPSTYTYSNGQQLYDAFCLPPPSATSGPPSNVPTSLLTDTVDPTTLPTQTEEPSAVTTIDVVTKRQESPAPSTTGAPTIPTDPAYVSVHSRKVQRSRAVKCKNSSWCLRMCY